MEGLTEADGARAQALGVLAALISAVLNSRLRFCGMNVLMTRERRRPDASGRRRDCNTGLVVRRRRPPMPAKVLNQVTRAAPWVRLPLRCSQ
jgi:hypothetical protein